MMGSAGGVGGRFRRRCVFDGERNLKARVTMRRVEREMNTQLASMIALSELQSCSVTGKVGMNMCILTYGLRVHIYL